jgi:hypothetical protein
MSAVLPPGEGQGEADDVGAESAASSASSPAGTPEDAAETSTASEVVAPSTSTEQFILTIGDIGVSPHWVVTPSGSAPLAGSQWIVRDTSRTEKKIPTYAIVLAIVFALLCLIGLLFLLIKEERVTGYVEVTVMSGDLQYMTQIPVSSQAQIARVRQDVAQAQSLAAAAR